jgi:hypothetical protein
MIAVFAVVILLGFEVHCLQQRSREKVEEDKMGAEGEDGGA